MAKYLKIEQETYRLPAEADLTTTSANVLETMAKGTAMSIKVEMDDNPLSNARVIINGRTATHVLLLETGEAEDSAPVLDLAG
jgi:hypothetical protein